MNVMVCADAFISKCPAGTDTVWGFMARTEPWIIETADDPVADFLDDQERAVLLANREGVVPEIVIAPGPVLAAGVEQVLAFPEGILRDLYRAVP